VLDTQHWKERIMPKRWSVTAALFTTVVVAAACGKGSVTSTDLSSSGSATASVASSAPTSQELARAELDAAWKKFANESSATLRYVNYREMRGVMEKLRGKLPDAELNLKISKRADEILAERESIKKALEALPEKPVYDGAFRLSGSVRKCYQDGVALESQGKLYFVKDAKCPDAPLLHGWVEDNGETVTLDFGRNGREAKIVEISDKEKAQDDRKAFNEKSAEYAKAIAANPTMAKEREAKLARDKELEDELEGVLTALAKGLPPPPPRAAPTTSSSPSDVRTGVNTRRSPPTPREPTAAEKPPNPDQPY